MTAVLHRTSYGLKPAIIRGMAIFFVIVWGLVWGAITASLVGTTSNNAEIERDGAGVKIIRGWE